MHGKVDSDNKNESEFKFRVELKYFFRRAKLDNMRKKINEPREAAKCNAVAPSLSRKFGSTP